MSSETTPKEIEWYQSEQNRAQVDTTDMGLGTLAEMVTEEHIDISPDYQRRDRWTTMQQSRLIDSFLRNLPVPPVYLAEDRNKMGEYAVIDGKQRLTAITKFLSNNLELTGLKSNPFNGKTYSQLPDRIRSSLRLKTIRIISLQHSTAPDIAHEVFERLNTGGTKLTPQELRNVTYRGTLNDCLIELARNKILVRQFSFTPKSKSFQKMDDVQLVLRYLTLKDQWRDFSGDLRKAMDRFMAENTNPRSDLLQAMKSHFMRSIDTVDAIWGNQAFQRPNRDQALTGVYDAQMLAISSYDETDRQKLIGCRTQIYKAAEQLFDDPDYYESITSGTNTPARLSFRVSRLETLLREFI